MLSCKLVFLSRPPPDCLIPILIFHKSAAAPFLPQCPDPLPLQSPGQLILCPQHPLRLSLVCTCVPSPSLPTCASIPGLWQGSRSLRHHCGPGAGIRRSTSQSPCSQGPELRGEAKSKRCVLTGCACSQEMGSDWLLSVFPLSLSPAPCPSHFS